MIHHIPIAIIRLPWLHHLGQSLLAVVALQRRWSFHLKVVDPLMVGNTNLLRDEDLGECGDDDGPEDGYRGADDGEVDFDASDGERCRVPPCKVLKLGYEISHLLTRSTYGERDVPWLVDHRLYVW
jgi:hypothetical protein